MSSNDPRRTRVRAWWRMTGATLLVARTLSSQGAHIELSIALASVQTGAEIQDQDTMGVSLLLLHTLLSVYMLAPTR